MEIKIPDKKSTTNIQERRILSQLNAKITIIKIAITDKIHEIKEGKNQKSLKLLSCIRKIFLLTKSMRSFCMVILMPRSLKFKVIQLFITKIPCT